MAKFDNDNFSIDTIINADPVLKAYLRTNEFNSESFNYQIDIMGVAILIALDKWLDVNY